MYRLPNNKGTAPMADIFRKYLEDVGNNKVDSQIQLQQQQAAAQRAVETASVQGPAVPANYASALDQQNIQALPSTNCVLSTPLFTIAKVHPHI